MMPWLHLEKNPFSSPGKVLRKKSPRAEGVGSCNFQFECFACPFRKTGSHVSSFTETVKTPMMKLCSCVTHGCHKQSAIAKVRKNPTPPKSKQKTWDYSPSLSDEVCWATLVNEIMWVIGIMEATGICHRQALRFQSFCMAGRISQLAEPQSFNHSPNVFLKQTYLSTYDKLRRAFHLNCFSYT